MSGAAKIAIIVCLSVACWIVALLIIGTVFP